MRAAPNTLLVRLTGAGTPATLVATLHTITAAPKATLPLGAA
jgi:hypothetical protein